MALGWLLGLSGWQGQPLIVPMPGSSKLQLFEFLSRLWANLTVVLASVEHIKENVAMEALTEEEMWLDNAIIAEHPILGKRYHSHGMKMVNLRDLLKIRIANTLTRRLCPLFLAIDQFVSQISTCDNRFIQSKDNNLLLSST